MINAQLDDRRFVQAEGACNLRDLGGYATSDGGEVRWGAMYRSAGLHRLSEASRATLIERGIRTVIDLRHDHEVESKPNVLAAVEGVAYHHISLLRGAPAAEPIRNLGELYVWMLDGAGEELRQVFAVLADNAAGQAALFHCAAGKDRTGVVAGLLLALAGVPHAAIAEDYALTGACIAPIMDELRAGRPESVSEEQYEVMLGSDPADMLAMLRHLDDKYGGAARYLVGIGLSEEQVGALRERLVQR